MHAIQRLGVTSAEFGGLWRLGVLWSMGLPILRRGAGVWSMIRSIILPWPCEYGGVLSFCTAYLYSYARSCVTEYRASP